MSPSLDHGRGTYVLDFHVKGIGRVRRASGTTDLRTYNDIKAMFRLLKKMGRQDIIRAVYDKLVTPMEVWERYRTGKLDQLPSAESIRGLWGPDGALAVWHQKIKTMHRANSVRQAWLALAKLDPKAKGSIADLPKLLATYRIQCEAAEHGQSFRSVRNNVRAFLRDTVGKSHPLYVAVAHMATVAIDREPGNPFTAAGLAAFLKDVEAKYDAETTAMARSLAFSGMRPVEYWREWEHLTPDVIRVLTAKQRNGKKLYRRVPVVVEITKPTTARRTFEDRMREVTREHVCYDLRRTYMHLAEQAAIPRSRRMAYLGHAAGDVSGRYEEHEVTAYLAGDVAQLRASLATTFGFAP